MKYIFIGDIHGKVDQVERALAMDGQKIFVGDFIDSFDRTPSEHARCYELVIAAIKAEEAQAIYGNHELSYLEERQHRCSGFDLGRAHVVAEYEERIRKLFVPHILLAPDFLVTHAGLTKPLWDSEHLTLATLDVRLKKGFADVKSFVHWIGHARGGPSPVGGTFWCDYGHEFQPVPGLTQVFGHTRGNGVRQTEQSFCVDCLDRKHEFLEMDLDLPVMAEAA